MHQHFMALSGNYPAVLTGATVGKILNLVPFGQNFQMGGTCGEE